MAERRYTLVLYTAILTAVGATFGVYRVLETTKASSRLATQPVVVASQDLSEGAPVDRVALTVTQWPAGTAPAGAFSSIDSVVGRVTRVAVFQGEPIVPGRLAPAGTGPGLEVKITPGKRAMSVRINDVAGISGMIQPNNRVDVLVTLEQDGNTNEKSVAKLFMENMRVLGVGTQVDRDANGKPISATTATLEVSPEESERLAVAMNQGSIQLVLRGYGDPDSIKTRGARANDVLAQLRSGSIAAPRTPVRRAVTRRERPAPVVVQQVIAPPPRPDSTTVQVFRGDKVTSQKFEARGDGSTASVPQR
jgi:pilus assembly protein CpaB